MIRSLLRIGGVAIALSPLTAAGHAQTQPSVLVQLTMLHKGSLPRIVTAYGRVQANASARHTVMAPLSAVVQDVDVQPGQTVAKHAPLLRLTPSPSAAAAYAQAQSGLSVAKELVARTRRMVAQHLATQQQLANARKAESDAQATLAALKAQGADGPKTIHAPSEAIVTAVSVTPGSIVSEGSALLSLVQPRGLVLQVGVIPGEAASVTTGDPVTITPIGGGATLKGIVSLRGSLVQSSDGLVPVNVTVPNKKLVPGEMAKAEITTGRVKGYIVPHQAVLVNDQGKPYVVQSVAMIAKKVRVRILGAKGDKDVVAGPLNAAAPLVLAGNHQLDNGMRMRVAEAGRKTAP